MNYDKQSRLESLAALVLATESSGTKEGWRDYIENEMKMVGLTNREIKAEMQRQKIGGMCKQSE